MDKIEKIRQEIKRLRKEIKDEKDPLAPNQKAGYLFALTDMESFLDILSEEPCKGLEEEIQEYMSNEDNNPFDWDWRDKRDCARHFAEWQASQMPMPEDTVLFQKGVAEGRRLEREDMLKDAVDGEIENEIFGIIYLRKNLVNDGYSAGDKVRIFVLKEEEE